MTDYQFIDENPIVEERQIEAVKQVEHKERLTIKELKREIAFCDEEIALRKARKAELKAKLDEIRLALSIT